MMNRHSHQFGNDFVWGVAASAFQTEGAYLTGGKGLSIWDAFCNQPGKIHAQQNAHTACDFYNYYIQDLILMNYMNIRNFRFSLSWPRIYPDGTGVINTKGLDFYDRLVDYCLEMDIEPWVTLYHWDLPRELELKGGWTNRDIIHWFTDYVTTCVKHLGDRVKNWMVLNEPMVFTGAGYYLGIHAPGKKSLNAFLAAAHHAVLCQSLGAKAIRTEKSDAFTGTTFSTTYIDPYDHTPNHIEAAIKMDVLANRLFIEPLLGLGYPCKDLKVLEQIEKFMLPDDEQLMKEEMDFIGLQNYTREVVKFNPFIPVLNARIIKAHKRNVPATTKDWEIYPESIYHVLKKFSAYPQIKKIIVTENGAAFNDQLENGAVHDVRRVRFLQNYIEQVLKAKKEGAKADGYFVWSFTDNFEWAEGFRQRFGLVYIDYSTQKRIIKSSGHWYREFLSEAFLFKQEKALISFHKF